MASLSYKSAVLQALQTLNRLSEWYAAPPVVEVQVEIVGFQAFQALLAGTAHIIAACVFGQDLGDDKKALTVIGRYGFANQRLALAAAVHLGGVDKGHAMLDASAQGGDLLCTLVGAVAYLPGALTYRRNGNAAFENDFFRYSTSL